MSTIDTPTAPSFITPELTIGELASARPALVRLFEKIGIDYCCGGKQTLAVACARRGLDLATTLVFLESAALLSPRPAEVDAAAMSLTQLADHIEATHHAYLKTELPRLIELAQRVATKHDWRDGRLPEVAETVRELAEEMLGHLGKEEVILFPLVRQIDAGKPSGLRGNDLSGAVAQMEAEHAGAGQLVAQLRELTDGFTPGAEACETHRALLAGLVEFERDLHLHVHKENNVLFPRALALERR